MDTTWDQAREACLNIEAHLVTMDTDAEWEKVKAAIVKKVAGNTTNQHWFIGLRDVNGTWTWQEPAGLVGGTVSVNDQRWQDNEPSDSFDEPCAEIQSNYRGEQGYFNNVICDEKPSDSDRRGYICEPGN